MDLSTLTAPAFGATGETASDAADSLRAATRAVRQFGSATWGLQSDLRRQSAQLRQARDDGRVSASDPFGLRQATSAVRGVGSLASSAKGLGSFLGLTSEVGGAGSFLSSVGSFTGALSAGFTAVNLIGSLFGGKKPSVGPGGEFNFLVDPNSGAAIATSTAQDNGYDAVAVNQASADAIGSAALAFFRQIGGVYQGVEDPAYSAGHIGYNAGDKKYYGGRATGFARPYDTAEQAAEAALIDVIKYAKVEGLSKDLQDRLKSVNESRDLEGLLDYIAQLRSVFDGFQAWTAPLTDGEAAIAALNAGFMEAKSAADSLSLSIEGLEGSYARQRAYLTEQFSAPLETRYLRATGNAQAADLRSFDAQAAITRRDAAALGGAAVLQAERTLGAERAAIVRRYQTQVLDAATGLALAAQNSLEKTYRGLADELQRARDDQIEGLSRSRALWQEVAGGLQKARDSLLVGRLSPLDPQAQLIEAQRQFSAAMARAKAGDAGAASQAQSLAEQALTQAQSYYAGTQPYAAYFQQVHDQLAALQTFSATRASSEDQQLAALRGAEVNTRSIAEILRDMAAVQAQIGVARANVVAQAAGGGQAGSAATAAISGAYQSALGREPDFSGGTYWANQIATGVSTVDQVVKQINASDEAKVYGAYQELLGRAPDEAGGLFWRSTLANGSSVEELRAGIMASAEYQSLKKFASGGDHAGGWRIVGERGPELEATGPARIWSFDQTQKLMSNDNSAAAGALAALSAKLDALIRVSASAGDENAQGLAALRDELAELRRRARLSEAA